MKNQIVLVSLIALFAVMTVVAAGDSLDIGLQEVTLDNQELSFYDCTQFLSATGESGNTVPLEINFLTFEEAEDVEISAWFNNYREDRVDMDYHDLILKSDGSPTQNYAKLDLKLPEDIEPEEELTLNIRIESDSGNFEREFQVVIIRKSYALDVLFVEADNKVKAGDVLGVDVVVENIGRHELENVIVTARIPELGVSKRAYLSDLAVTDEVCNKDLNGFVVVCDNEDEDSAQGKIFLNIPETAKAGTYTLEVTAENKKATSKVTKTLVVEESADKSDVIVPIASKEIAVDEEATFDLVILNAGNKIKVYEIVPESTGLQVVVSEPLVTVPADSSRTVKVKVIASEKGTYSFGLNVNSNGELVKRATLSATAKEAPASISGTLGSITILTVVLAVVFVVLLIVLIVLLTRKPEKQELGESYY